MKILTVSNWQIGLVIGKLNVALSAICQGILQAYVLNAQKALGRRLTVSHNDHIFTECTV